MAQTVTLGELAKLIRSKNAGPFMLTFDVMFGDEESYRRVLRSGALTKASFARMYQLAEEDVSFFEHEAALAIKISIPRPTVQGDPGDGDMSRRPAARPACRSAHLRSAQQRACRGTLGLGLGQLNHPACCRAMQFRQSATDPHSDQATPGSACPPQTAGEDRGRLAVPGWGGSAHRPGRARSSRQSLRFCIDIPGSGCQPLQAAGLGKLGEEIAAMLHGLWRVRRMRGE